MKWKPLKFDTLLRLLQPVAKSWDRLAGFLLENKFQHKIGAIQKDADRINADALDKTLSKWLQCTVREKRTWKVLCDTARKHGDELLEQYILNNCLECEFNVANDFI